MSEWWILEGHMFYTAFYGTEQDAAKRIRRRFPHSSHHTYRRAQRADLPRMLQIQRHRMSTYDKTDWPDPLLAFPPRDSSPPPASGSG